MESVKTLAEITSWTQACAALDVSRVSAYRFWRRKDNPIPPKEPYKPRRALSASDREQVLEALNSERFVDLAPSEVYATLLDEDKYMCSIRTMYRILGENNEIRERRNQIRHIEYAKPELLATCPNELWSWDITKLKGPTKWSYYHLYVIIDVFSRYAVGWMIADRESSELAKKLISETIRNQEADPTHLTIHADRKLSTLLKQPEFLISEQFHCFTHFCRWVYPYGSW